VASQRIVPWAAIFILVYPISVPLIYFALLRANLKQVGPTICFVGMMMIPMIAC
jgi:hypothetical protein